MLVPLLVALFFVAVAERGHPATGKAGAAGIVAALEDPLSLFGDRSPGGRGAGALLSTKPERTAALADGPEERVLSGVRDRDPGFGDIPPGLGDPVFGVGPEASVAGRTLPGDAPPSDDPFSGGPLGGPSFASSQPLLGQAPPGFLSDPGVPAVPEPGTWAMMILGFFAVGLAVRRRARKQTGAASVS